MKEGMTIRFAQEGNESELKRVGDLVVTLHSADGEQMTRQGDDLIYHHRITLK
jgi:DnaJ-class molecular chaperone